MAKAGKPQTLLLWISLCMLDLIFVDSRCYVQWIGDEMCCGHKWGRWGCLNLFPIEIITGCQFKLRHVGRSWEILFEYKLWWMQMILANACNCPYPLLLHSNGKMASAWIGVNCWEERSSFSTMAHDTTVCPRCSFMDFGQSIQICASIVQFVFIFDTTEITNFLQRSG